MLDFGVFRATDEAIRIPQGAATMEMIPSVRLDETFSCLANGYRRQILLAVLLGPTEGIDWMVRDLNGSRKHPQQLRTELYHIHLPKLDTAGYIYWNRETWALERGPRFHEIEPMLQLLLDNTDQLPSD
ncbi:ArsR family transcriptional regulator [Haloferax namakaokahaiae]|uniref:ArsR family transcriptional regulator n=1 Tax=Haloferax namakaokahaiae TaxID=1748331 RepID=A0ABD5ZCQ2_9EURY